MKKKFRVKSSDEFTKIMKQKHYASNASFTVYWEKRKEDHVRVGISVPKKIGKAVTRNLIKRQVRMMIDSLVNFKKGKRDLIVIIRKGYLDNTFADNKNDLEILCKKAII